MTQKEALDILKMGHNVFLTGPAGSGKTFLLNTYIDYLRKCSTTVAITASTGIAATHMEGLTIHSWSGIGIRTVLTRQDMKRLFYNDHIRERIARTKVLVIDEISMLADYHIDLVDQVCRELRENALPFGGLQVVFCGDFFQLPPIQEAGKPAPKFAYSALAWKNANVQICYLEKQFRQKDQELLDALNAIRGGEVSNEIVKKLMERHNVSVKGFSKPTRLYTHNIDVDAVNAFELSRIRGPEVTYAMHETGEPELVIKLKKGCLAPAVLALKKDAVVMFLKNNFTQGFVNGTIGVVIGFEKDNNYPIVRLKNDKEIIVSPDSWKIGEDGVVDAQITQIPLRLAWAITIHKSQGMSLDCAEIDLSKAFSDGMGYVALSRVRSLAGIKLIGLNDQALRVNNEVIQHDEVFREKSEKVRKELKALSPKAKRTMQKNFSLR